ncbi:MAG TPA: hypothetical protein VIW70_08590, partial [Rubrivivax sp.]
ALRGALRADAQQGVDDKVEGPLGALSQDGHAGLLGTAQACLCVCAQPVALCKQRHDDIASAMAQVGRSMKPVAPIAARARRDPDPARMGCQRERQPRHRSPSLVHELAARARRKFLCFDQARCRDAKERPRKLCRQYTLRRAGV